MGFLFLDTSALAKRYVIETGSQWVTALFATHKEPFVYIAEVTTVEITSAIVRRAKGGAIPPEAANSALEAFERHIETDYLVLEVKSALLRDARILARSHGLRGYDAVQLAVALRVNASQLDSEPPIILVSADGELLAAAADLGLATANPNHHA